MQNNGSNVEGHPKRMQFVDFFLFWVTHLFNDVIEWRNEISKCITDSSLKKCNNRCNRHCKCFPKWVKQKQDEWNQIKAHYKHETGFGNANPHDILEYILENNFLDEIKKAYGNEKEIDRIKNLTRSDPSKTEVKTENDKYAIDVLLKDEEEDAEKCKKCKPPEDKSRGRSDSASPDQQAPRSKEEKDADSHDDFDEEEDDDEDSHDGDGAEGAEQPEETAEGPAVVDHTGEGPEEEESPPTDHKLNVCNIVNNILTGNGNLNEACTQKYGPKAPTSWKCIPTNTNDVATISESERAGPARKRRDADSGKPTGSSSGDTTGGSICVPPRRRKLYVTPLTKWADTVGNTATQPQGGTSSAGGKVSSQSDKLRTAFIESAAIETFFLWDRYKKEWKVRRDAELQQENGLVGAAQAPQLQPPGSVSGEQTPENQLSRGNIPPDFLRLMFYTLADYKDILFSGIKDKKSGYSDIFSGDKDIAEREKQIKGAIQTFFQNGDSQTPSGKDPESWWQAHGPDIWNGMICALTYKDNDARGTSAKIEQNSDLKDKLWDEAKKQPKKDEYQYTNVKLKDEPSETQARTGSSTTSQTTQSSPSSDNNPPKLTEFVEIPTFFRYLHEWGQNFCKERKKRLAQIYKDCQVDENNGPRGAKQNPKCSGYGEDCQTNLKNDPSTIPSLECPDCARHCRFYKKWIERKKDEFTQQSNAYDKQKTKYETESNGAKRNNHDNGFCVTLEKTCDTAAKFLKTLGPCKNENGEDKKGDLYIKFDEDKSFKHTEYCDSCPKFNVNCKENGNCSKDKRSACKTKNKRHITAEDINGSTEDIGMVVSDDSKSGSGFENGLEPCKDAHIFKGFRKDVWTCEKVCGYVVCKPIKVNGETTSGEKGNDKHIIQIRALLRLWLEYFLEDYNKIKHKISHCMKKGEEPKCIKECGKKCNCVEQWIKLKQQEWQQIKNRLLDQYKYEDQPDYPVTSFLQELIPQIAVTIDKAEQETLEKLEKSLKCNCTDNSKTKDGNKSYVID
ncbi:hypothetical protein PFUGPA_06034, partial [Plasmodium falciparum Palo Alto/Uganda]